MISLQILCFCSAGWEWLHQHMFTLGYFTSNFAWILYAVQGSFLLGFTHQRNGTVMKRADNRVLITSDFFRDAHAMRMHCDADAEKCRFILGAALLLPQLQGAILSRIKNIKEAWILERGGLSLLQLHSKHFYWFN